VRVPLRCLTVRPFPQRTSKKWKKTAPDLIWIKALSPWQAQDLDASGNPRARPLGGAVAEADESGARSEALRSWQRF
jgi:hypothetical protein